jgi:hypothetical protein
MKLTGLTDVTPCILTQNAKVSKEQVTLFFRIEELSLEMGQHVPWKRWYLCTGLPDHNTKDSKFHVGTLNFPCTFLGP